MIKVNINKIIIYEKKDYFVKFNIDIKQLPNKTIFIMYNKINILRDKENIKDKQSNYNYFYFSF